jgi:hypothetical protein
VNILSHTTIDVKEFIEAKELAGMKSVLFFIIVMDSVYLAILN